MEKLNNTSNLGIREIEGAYGLRIEQPEVTLIKIGDTSMIAKAFGVAAKTQEELIQNVADSYHLETVNVKTITLGELRKLKKRVSDSGKVFKIF